MGVHLAEGQGHGLRLQLAGNGELGAALEEVLAEVHLAVLGFGHVVQVQSGHAEHLARALTVRAGEDRGVHVDEALLLEEAVDGVGRGAAHPECGREGVGAGAQMGHGAQKLNAVALFLQGIVGGAAAEDGDLVGVDLKGLLGLRGQHDAALHFQAGVGAGLGDLGVVFQLVGLKNHLQALEAAAVGQLNEADLFGIPNGFVGVQKIFIL